MYIIYTTPKLKNQLEVFFLHFLSCCVILFFVLFFFADTYTEIPGVKRLQTPNLVLRFCSAAVVLIVYVYVYCFRCHLCNVVKCYQKKRLCLFIYFLKMEDKTAFSLLSLVFNSNKQQKQQKKKQRKRDRPKARKQRCHKSLQPYLKETLEPDNFALNDLRSFFSLQNLLLFSCLCRYCSVFSPNCSNSLFFSDGNS